MTGHIVNHVNEMCCLIVFNWLRLLVCKVLTYVVVNAFGRRGASLQDVVIVAMIDQQNATWLQALLKVFDRLLVLALITETVHQMGKGVAQTNDRIEANIPMVLDIVEQSQPVGLLDSCNIRLGQLFLVKYSYSCYIDTHSICQRRLRCGDSSAP